MKTAEQTLIFSAKKILQAIADNCKEYYNMDDDMTVLAFDNNFITEMMLLLEKMDYYKKGVKHFEN